MKCPPELWRRCGNCPDHSTSACVGDWAASAAPDPCTRGRPRSLRPSRRDRGWAWRADGPHGPCVRPACPAASCPWGLWRMEGSNSGARAGRVWEEDTSPRAPRRPLQTRSSHPVPARTPAPRVARSTSRTTARPRALESHPVPQRPCPRHSCTHLTPSALLGHCSVADG